MIRKLFILLFVTSFTVSQNFAYNPDDWYVIKNPGQIYSITEGPFNKIYFGTENGIFSYNPLNETLKYDYELNQGLDYDEMIIAIHYDKYSNQIWIATNRGVFYKSPIFTTFNEVSFTVNDLYNSYSVSSIGSTDRYIVLNYGLEYIFIDSFSGYQVEQPINFDFNSVSWSSDYNQNNIDLSSYYADDWLIGFRTITDTYGNYESVIVRFEDSNMNFWFGTNKGKIIKGYKYSKKLEIYNIGPFSNNITSIANDNQNWYLSSGRFRISGELDNFKYNKGPRSFISVWNDYNNSWKDINEDMFYQLNNPDVNYISIADDRFLIVGLMSGLLIISKDNYKKYYFIEEVNGLSSNAVFKVAYYDNQLFIMSEKGVSIYSLKTHFIIEENIFNQINVEDSVMMDMFLNEGVLYLSTKAGLISYDIDEREFDKISDKVFHQIEHHNDKLYGLSDNIWIIDLLTYDEYVFKFDSGYIRNFELSNGYMWLNLVESLKLINMDSKEEWVYDHNDGFLNIEIFDIESDGDWVCILTNNGLIFYNWSNYHY